MTVPMLNINEEFLRFFGYCFAYILLCFKFVIIFFDFATYIHIIFP